MRLGLSGCRLRLDDRLRGGDKERFNGLAFFSFAFFFSWFVLKSGEENEEDGEEEGNDGLYLHRGRDIVERCRTHQ